jgi:serine/threonine-protein kinase
MEANEVPPQLDAYEIVEEIGRGGMGAVYAARHIVLGHVVALKVVAGGRFATAEQQMRFVREAQTAARLRHPNIVAVHDAGRASGVAYFAMDLIADGDLAQRVRSRPLPTRAAAVMLHKIALAVEYAHREGVLHRDLKPSNVLL